MEHQQMIEEAGGGTPGQQTPGAPLPPPSPLSGCYLLIVIGEPHSQDHKEIILQRIAKGFLSWNSETSHVDLEKELEALTSQAPEGEEARNGERLIQYATENLVTEVLIHPQVNTLLQCVRNLLSSFTRHRHLIHAGYAFAGNGSWILQDGTFSLVDFIDAFVEPEVQRVLRAYENCITVDVHCSPEGDWTTERIAKEAFARSCKVRVNPDDHLTAGGTSIGNFITYVSPFLRPASLEQLLEPSDVVGNIRFSHPTLYVFPGGQGDAALFGINGFNMLVDGGFARKACFWDFARHLDRLDAVLMTRLNNGNVNGISAVLRRKKQNTVYPQIGHFFCNLQEKRHATSPDGDKDRDALVLDLLDEGQEIVFNLRHLQLRPHPCYRDGNHVEPVNLYHKVGHGKLDMYIISPAKDSRDVKEFLSKWNTNDPRLFVGRKESASRDFHFPLQNLVSICALLVWQPANPNDTITRILFPGSTPQHKIFEGLDKLKHLEFLKHPVCTAKSTSPSASTVGITSRASSKQRSAPAVIDKLLPGEGIKATSKTIGSTMETNKEAIRTATIPVAGHIPDAKQTKPAATAAPVSAPVPMPSKALPQTKQKVDKLTSKTEPPKMKTELNKSLDVEKISAKSEKATKMIVTETTKSKGESRPKTEPRASIGKSRTEPKLPRSTERKNHKPPTEKKSESAKSSPTTPKKSVEGKMNGAASKAETAKLTRPLSRSRPSPTATPAKSTKEANNRKVVESKHASRMSSTSRVSTTKVRREQQEIPTSTKTERKPISRRPKPGSPGKVATSGKSPGSPAKSSSAKSTPTPSVKSDKDGVIRKVKGEADRITTDSSAVSTPSTVDPETAALKVKAAEVSEATSTISEAEKLGKETEEKVSTDKETETSIVKPEQEKSEEICENVQMAADEAQIQDAAFTTEAQQEKYILPPDEKREEESPMAEAEIEQEGMEEDEETENKESEIAEEMPQVKQTVIEKDDIEATEEENTDDVEDEEEGEEKQHIEGRKSLADELEFEAKEHKEIKVEEEEEEEDEYLIIEKEEVEQFMDDSLQDQESVESHVPEELEAMERRDEEEEVKEEEEDEGELHKHLRDEVESEKEKKHEHEKDIIKINGFREEPKDITEKEDKEYIKEEKHSPLKTELEEERGEKPEVTPTDKTVAEEEENLKITAVVNKQEEAETKQVAIETVPSTGPDEMAVSTDMSTVPKEQLQEEVQGIISFAEEIVTKTKQENDTKLHDTEEVHVLKDQNDLLEQVGTEEKKDTEDGEEMKEASSITPEEKLDISSEKNREITEDTRDTDQKLDEEEGAEIKAADQRYPAEESQPDERFSTTVESAATTAPTLPEDERIPLDEIKEIVEEKYVKEETKEEKLAATATATVPSQPTTLPQVVVAAGVGMFDPMAPHAVVHLERDIVKTPDEVADLPVHEEVDPGMYESDEFGRDFKGKNDIAKKQPPQQDLEDSRQQSPEFDIKGKLQPKYDDNIEKATPLEDSKFVDQVKETLPAVDKDEPKETIETESEKKTEKAEEPRAPDIDFSADKIEGIGKVPDLKEEKGTEFTKGLIDQKETEAHVLTKHDVNIEDTDKLSATIEAVSKSDTVEDKKTATDKVVHEELSENVVKLDTEKDKGEGPLEKGTGDSTLVHEEGLEGVVKQEVLDESKETSKPASETEGEHISYPEEKREQSGSEFKSTAEVSAGEGQMFDSRDEIKHITEQFIEKESCAVKLETLLADKQHDQPAFYETTKQESDKLELDAIAVEKSDVEKPVFEESKEEKALEDLAGETSELENMDLKETGKGLESLEKEAVKTEQMKSTEEKDESNKVFPDALSAEKVHDPEKQLFPDITSEESAKHTKPGQEKTDVQKAEFEEDSEKLDNDKSVTKESKSEWMEDVITKPEELSKDNSVPGSSDHSEFEKHDVTKEYDIHTKSSELKQTAELSEADIIKSEDADLGGTETKTKGTVAVKEIILTKEGTTDDGEKDIDEKDKASKDLSLKSEDNEEIKTDIPKLNVDALKCTDAEVPNLIAEDKPSPGALSMTYLEIIDKLQKDSQKTDDSAVDTAEESSPITELKQDASEGALAGDVSDTLPNNDNKTDEISKSDITGSVTETHSSKRSDIEGTDSVQTATEIKYGEIVGDSTKAVTKTDNVDSDESAGGRPLIATDQLKDLKDVTEFVPAISKEEDTGTKIESENEKSCNKMIIETKSDQVSDACKLKEPTTTGLPQMTDKDSEDSIKVDTEKIVGSKTPEEVEKSKPTIDATDLQGELKLADDKDDSYGDGSISPDEAYVDSGLEEEPVYRKLEGAEVAEYVTVTPDSAPPSPKSQKDKKPSPRTDEKDGLQQESLAAVKTAFENTEIGGLQEDNKKIDSITFQKDFGKAKHESPTDDLLVSDKYDSTTEIKEKALDLVADTSKKEVEATVATADIPTQMPVTTAVSEGQRTPSSDQPTEGSSSSVLKMQEFGEANVLEDLVSASKSAIAEIEGKLSSQIEEILMAPRQESHQTKSEIQESKSQISSDTTDKIRSSVDEALTGTSQVLQEEVIRESEDEEEAKSSPTHVTETGETILKSIEKGEHESSSVLTGKDHFEKGYGSPDMKQGSTEDTSSTELSKREDVLTSADVHDVETSAVLKEISTSSTPPSVISKEVSQPETDISKAMKEEVTESTNVDQSTVSTTKETTITNAEGTAENKTNVTIASITVTVPDGTEKAVCGSGNLTSSVTVCRMVMTASSEDGGMETELCSGESITAPTASIAEPATSEYGQKVPGSSSNAIQCTGVTLSGTSKHVIGEDTGKVTEDNVSKGDISETAATAGTTNGDICMGDDSASDGEGSSKLVTRTTKEPSETDEIELDDRDNVEEFTTQEIGEDGKIVTKTVKTTRTFVTAQGEESDDSDFEDEDNVESTAAEDGSDSSRMSKITSSLTTVTKRDDNGVRSLSTDSIDKTAGDVDSEVVTKTTTTAITTLSGDEAGEAVTITTIKEITVEVGSTTHDIIKDVDVLCKKEEVSRPDSSDSSKLADASKGSSPVNVTTTDISHCAPAQVDSVAHVSSGADGTEMEGKLTEGVGSKEEEKNVMNGNGSDKESMIAVSTTAVEKSVMGDLEEPSFVSVKKEGQSCSSELTRSGTPGSDAVSDSDQDVGCGPSTPHSGISSWMGTKNVRGSFEGHPDSRHCASDEEDDDEEPGSPLSVTSQLAPSPPSNFYFEMSDRVTPDYEAKHFIATSTKHKEGVPSSMTSSLYGSFPPEPFQESVKEQTETQAHFSPSSLDETPVKYSGTVSTEDNVMTGSFYGSLDNKGTESHSAENSEKRLQEDEALDFERAKYEHRAARGKDLTSSGTSYMRTSSPTHATKKYEFHYMSGVNGQKLKDDNSFHELTQEYGNANVAAGKQYEDLMNQNRDIKEMEYNGKIAARFVDPSGSGSHQEPYPKETEHISGDILKEKKETLSGASGIEHDPMFHHQFSAPTTSASSFPEPPQEFTQPSGVKEDKKKDPIAGWGKPLGLPAPTPPPTNSNTAGEDLPSTPKREKKMMQIKKTMNESNKTVSGKDSKSKRPDSPMKRPISERKVSSNKEGGRTVGGGKASGSPIYINLTYVPHHGNSYYTTLEFFKKVRARYYVFSGTEPSREVYNALLDAKQTWEDKELEVTIIPTYDTDTLGYWVAENEDALAMYKIDLSPSASRCTINLQDHETSCSAYRLEF